MSTQFAPQLQTIDDVFEWYNAVVESILAHRSAIFASVRQNALASTDRYFAMTYEEIDRFFAEERRQLDFMANLAIMASAEATLRVDYHERVVRRSSDILSKAYSAFHKSLHGTAKSRPPFDEGILETLKKSGAI